MVPMNNNNNARRANSWLPDVFNDFFGDDWNWLTTSSKSTPAINVAETDKEYKVEVAVPGIKKEDCKIRLNDDVMTI